MKLIKPSFEILDQQCGLEGIYKQIEISGRTCYKSEDKITEDSAKKFVDMLIERRHLAMLEHGTVYLTMQYGINREESDSIEKYVKNKYSKSTMDEHGKYHITTNLRVLVENGWLDDLQYICEPTEYHEKRVTVRFICDTGVSHEFVRHRVFSFAQESTRYCDYTKDRFNRELTFIKPLWISNIPITDITEDEKVFIEYLKNVEDTYFFLRDSNWTPQEARAVLPKCVKTELVMTGFVSDWKHFFALRDAASAHPQAQELAHPLHETFIQRGLIK